MQPISSWLRPASFAALALCLLAPAPAQARKECRKPPTAEAVAEEDAEAESSLHWARGNDSSWVHAGDPQWLHADTRAARAEAEAEDVAYDPSEGNGWVHETDYGWWAAVPQGLNEIGEDEEEASDAFDDTGLDCNVSDDRNECVVLANQVATYRFRLGLAIEREDALWGENLVQTIQRLEARAIRRGCTWVEPSLQEQFVQTVEAVVRAVGVAAQVYSMFYRMGLF